MGLINWGAVTPPNDQGPAREVASISGLLSALAERRIRAAEVAQQHEMAERQFQAQQANQLADNTRADADLSMRRDQQTDLTQHWRQEETLRKQTAATAALREAEKWAETDPERARRMLAEAGYQSIQGDAGQPAGGAPPPPAPALPPSPPAPPTGPQSAEPPPVVPESPNVFPGAAPQVPSAAPVGRAPGMPGMPPAGPASAPATPGGNQPPLSGPPPGATASAPPPPTRYMSPTGSTLDFDPGAIAASSRTKRKADADAFRASVQGTSTGPFAKQALQETYGAMLSPTWDPGKEDPFKMFTERQNHLEQRASNEKIGVARLGVTESNSEANRQLSGIRALRADLRENSTRWRVKDDLKDFNEVKKALNLIDTKAGSAQATAIDNLVKVGRGGVVTKQSLEFIVSHMGGTMDKVLSAFEKIKSGQWSDPAVADARTTLQKLHDTILAEVKDKQEEFKNTYLTGEEYAPMRANLQDEYEKEFGPFGYHVTPQAGAKGTDYHGKAFTAKAARPPEDDPRTEALRRIEAKSAELEKRVNSLGGK